MANEDMSFFGLNRPEYIPATELFMSEAAWSLATEKSRKQLGLTLAPNGLAFGSRATHKNDKVHSTMPFRDEEEFELASQQIAVRFGQAPEVGRGILDTLLNEIENYASEKSIRSTAIPVTIAASLMQDARGITGKQNPVNVAQIIEKIYAAGGGRKSAATSWVGALNEAEPAGLPDWIEDALEKALPAECTTALSEIKFNTGGAKAGLRTPKWLEGKPTPFHWLANSWDALCSNQWVNAMPRRRFADWASCLTRTGVATTYLFEMHLNTRMVAALGSELDAKEVVENVIEDSKRLLFWDDHRSASAADVGPSIKQLSFIGTSCQDLLKRFKEMYPELPSIAEYDDEEEGLTDWLEDARSVLAPYRTNVSKEIALALDNGKGSGAKNVFETIRYSLLVRGGHQSTDLYGFLKQCGPYTCVDPGQEWLVVIASLCSTGPRQPSRLADLSGALSDIGISVPRSTLIGRLESYGLARSSHDADDALEIQPAF